MLVVTVESEYGRRDERGTHVNDPSVLLLSENRPNGFRTSVSSLDVNFLNDIPFFLGHRLERLVS